MSIAKRTIESKIEEIEERMLNLEKAGVYGVEINSYEEIGAIVNYYKTQIIELRSALSVLQEKAE